MSFEQLLQDVETLAKSQGAGAADAGDDAAAAEAKAAADAAAAKAAAAADGGGGDEGEGDEGEGEGDESFAKAFSATLADGSEGQFIDATDLLKALGVEVTRINGERKSENEHLGAALGIMADLLKAQSTQIAELKTQIVQLSTTGRGRKAIVSVHDSPDAAAAAAAKSPGLLIKSATGTGVPANEFMAKAMEAQTAGRISSRDVAIAEGSLNAGMQVPDSIVSRVLQ